MMHYVTEILSTATQRYKHHIWKGLHKWMELRSLYVIWIAAIR